MSIKPKTNTGSSKKGPTKAQLKAGPSTQKLSKPSRAATPPSGSKLDQIQAALTKPHGVSLAMLMTMTGWQAHSVRGALAGALKVKRNLTIGSEVRDGVRFYRIEGQQ